MDKSENIWKEAVVAYSRYYSEICVGGPSKTMINLGQDRLCLGRDESRPKTTTDIKLIKWLIIGRQFLIGYLEIK
jgi:hypothetical protein